MRSLAATLTVLVLLTACADDGASISAPTSDPDGGSAVIVTTTTGSPDQPTSAPTVVTTDGPPPTTSAAPSAPTAAAPSTSSTSSTAVARVGDPVVTAVEVARVDRPVDLAVRPGDDRLYVVEQDGRIARIESGQVEVVADLSELTGADGERGLLGLAFSPDRAHAYVNYTDSRGDTVIAEYLVTDDGLLDIASRREVLIVDQPFGNHNAGDLAFGPDGLLWIPLGDGGSGGDPRRLADDPTTLLGSLLRIDPRPDGDRPYTIPPDNPFASGPLGDVSGAPEVWAWGLRNPWKIDFDPVTGELWIADVGQNRMEEVDLVAPVDGRPAGFAVDFGWSAFEGTDRFNTDVDGEDVVFPVLTYEHGSDGCSISGGAPYRGTAIAELEPAYVYSDFCSGILWALDLAGGRNLTLLTGFQGVTAVRAGPDGELYVLEQGGGVHLIAPA